MNKLERYMENLNESALKQIIRFVIAPENVQDSISNIGFVKLQIEEMSRMYPEYKEGKQ